ncbi:MAG: hypothetical protein H6Q37_1180 [Chloroflexi bacterium]|nr:hypothetical protein [Chloroflexota bacterium]
MGCGSNGYWGPELGTHAPIISSQGAVAMLQTGCGQVQSYACSVLGWLHPHLDNLTASDLVVGAQT